MPQTRISNILAGERAITADTGLRLSRFFGTSETFWLRLQMDYETARARDRLAPTLEQIQPYHAVA